MFKKREKVFVYGISHPTSQFPILKTDAGKLEALSLASKAPLITLQSSFFPSSLESLI